MRLSVKTLAAMLIGLALAAFQFDTGAQSRSSSRSSSTSRSSSVSRSTSRSSGSASRQTTSGTYKRSSGSVKTAAPRPDSKPKADRPSSSSRRKADISPAERNPSRPSSGNSGIRPGGGKPAGKPSVDRPSSDKPSANRPSVNRPSDNRPPAHKPNHPKPDFKPGNHHKPMPVPRPGHPKPHRVHPNDRGFMHHHKLSHHWAPRPHYYGYRVRSLPVHAHRHYHGGVTYYCYNNIWYRPFGGHYVVCRPPFGTLLAANLIADLALTAVKISYYNSLVQANANILASNKLGVVQNFADAGASYYYQDGVFYTLGPNGQYMVIAPPAGALVESLPEDYEVVTLSDGNVYYKVDNTIYRMTIDEGKPYFEVVGQM